MPLSHTRKLCLLVCVFLYSIADARLTCISEKWLGKQPWERKKEKSRGGRRGQPVLCGICMTVIKRMMKMEKMMKPMTSIVSSINQFCACALLSDAICRRNNNQLYNAPVLSVSPHSTIHPQKSGFRGIAPRIFTIAIGSSTRVHRQGPLMQGSQMRQQLV